MNAQNIKGTEIRRAICRCCEKPIDLTREKIFFNPLIFGSDIETCKDCSEAVEKSGKESSFITRKEFINTATKSIKFVLL